MKKLNFIFLFFVLFIACVAAQAQGTLKVNLRYFMFNNKMPYLTLQVKTKTDGKLYAVPGIPMTFYMDEATPKNVIAKTVTDRMGEAAAIIPSSLKQAWDASVKHKFLAVSAASKEFEESNTEIEMTKARIVIDTARDGETRNINVTVEELKDNGSWMPVKEVETKAGVRRLSSVLPAGKEESYTTDSTGKFTAEFKRDSLPGDDAGNITLVAKTEDNEMFGNLIVEKTVPWGVKVLKSDDFDKRTLYSTRFRTPFWLLGMAYTVIGIVWGVLIYLIVVIVRVMRIGFKATVEES